jgi:protein SCO1/2
MRHFWTRRIGAAIGTLAMLAVLLTWLAARAVGGPPGAPPASIGDQMDRPLPPSIAEMPLRNQAGGVVTLADLEGKVVFFAPFLTSCQEECPITTGALAAMKRSIGQDGLAKRVVVAEITVDPGRDTPSRLAAYARYTGCDLLYLTGSNAHLARLWRYFGIFYQKVPEGSPPGINWQTHQPYTYDVNHSDGFILLDATLHERFVAAGMAKFNGISGPLRTLLDSQGRSNLAHPGGGNWTLAEGLDAVGWVLGQPVPVNPSVS